MERVAILGVPVDRVTRAQAASTIREWLKSGQRQVATPNPEMLVEAAWNPELVEVLKRTALNIPDGVGLLWAARRAGTPLPERVTGVDVMTDLCAAADVPVFLLGAWDGIAERTAEALKKKNPSLVIAGTYAGSPALEEEKSITDRINASGAGLLFVAYGAPRQELWIARNLSKMPGVRVAMGVGGAFDFLSGNRKRAPALLQTLGIEWLWRLVQEPSRFKRILTATVTFPWLVMTSGR